MTPWEAMDRLTEPQYAATLEWLDLQWDRPDLHAWLLMSVACEVRRVLSKKPNAIKIEDFKLKFEKAKPKARKATTGSTEPAPTPSPQEVAARTARSKGAWLGAMTLPVKKVSAETGEVLDDGRRGNRTGKAGGAARRGRGAIPRGLEEKPARDGGPIV